MAEPVCIAPVGDWTGEGAVWHAEEQALYWVDIRRFLIHRYDPDSKATWTWLFPEPPTTLGLTDRSDTLVVALASKIILWQPRNDARADFANPDKNWPAVRFNDGRPDPTGNFWAGTMQNNVLDDGAEGVMDDKAHGRLYRIAPDGSSTVEKTGIRISNTFAWSPDNKRFYFGDSLANTIYVWDYDAANGTIANERPFFTGFERGDPDGSAMDSAGYLWNARYGGACLVRVSPDGKVDRIVEMPVSNITTCTFGGPDLKTLYITTAAGGSKTPRLAGSLFSLQVTVPGLPENKFRLAGA